MHRIHAPLAAALLGLFAAAPASAQSQEKSDLAWSFSKGDTHRYDLTLDLEVKQGLSGPQPLPLGGVKVKVTLTLDETIDAVDGGVASVSAKVAGVAAETEAEMMGMPMPKKAFDSKAAEGADPALAALASAVDQVLTFKLSKQGEVTDLKGGTEIGKKILAAMNEQGGKRRRRGGGDMGGMGGMAGQETKVTLMAFEDGMLSSALNMVNHVLPGEAKREGDTWTIKQALRVAIGDMEFDGAYRHAGASKGKAQIGFKNSSDVVMKKKEGSDAASALGNLDLKVTKSSAKGLATFGEAKLHESEASFEVETEGNIPDVLKQQMQAMGGAPEGAKLSIGYKLTLRYVRGEAK